MTPNMYTAINRETDLLCFFHTRVGLLNDYYVQKESDTEMATVKYLATF